VKYFVEIEWKTYAGNPATKTAIIEAENEDAAYQKLCDRVKKYKRCMSICGGSAVKETP